MTVFDIHNRDSAPEAARPVIDGFVKKYGGLPNMMAMMAESPEILEAYLMMSGLWSRTALSQTERDVVLLAINRENACRYCMASQSFVSDRLGMPADMLAALRDGQPLDDPKLETLRSFATQVVRERGWVGEAAIGKLLEAGFTRRTVFEVILAAAFKTLSNYTDHVTDAPVDTHFQDWLWQKPEAAE